MRPRNWTWILFFLLAHISCFCLIQTPADAETIHLSYANFFPPFHIQAKLGEEWCKEIEKRSGGKVKISYYPGGVLLKGPKIYDGVLSDIADVGMGVFGYSRGIFTAMEAIDLPIGYPDGKTATVVINAFYNEFRPKELSKVKIMYLYANGPGLLHSKVPVNKLEDLKGLKVRSYGFNAELTKALGAVPVTMGQGEVYEALQKGVADATFSPMEVLKGWKQAEVIKYSIESKSIGYSSGFFVAMNLDRWNALPADVQNIIMGVNREWIPKHGQGCDTSDQDGREFTISKGNKIISMSEKEDKRWAAASQSVIETYITNAQKKGLPAKAYVDFLRTSLIKLNPNVGK